MRGEGVMRRDGVLERLRAVIEAEQGPLAEALVEPSRVPDADQSFGSLAAAGERARSDPREYALLLESILEGYLLHYARGRILEPSDPDLRLLGGDYLYALGLSRLAELGDLEAVGELADLISLCGQAHARAGEENAAAPWRLTAGLWALAALAVGGGGAWREQREAKRLARADGAGAADLGLAAARERAGQLGLGPRLERALIAFDGSLKADFSAT
jgi:hypothetical protein